MRQGLSLNFSTVLKYKITFVVYFHFYWELFIKDREGKNSSSCNVSNTRTSVWSCFQILKRKLKNEAQPSFLTKVRGVWKHDQTLVRVFDTTSQTNTYFRRKRRRKFDSVYASVWSCFQTRRACDFPVLASWIINEFEKLILNEYNIISIAFGSFYSHWRCTIVRLMMKT